MSRFHRVKTYRFPESCARDCTGAAVAQFALILPILLLTIFGVYEFGRLYWIWNTVQYATEQTARCIMAHTSVTTVSSGTCALNSNLPGLTVSNPTATSGNCSGTLAGLSPTPQCMTITATYTLPSTDPLNAIVTRFISMVSRRSVPGWSFTFTGTTTVTIS
jgi:Flp pilus assembly protein TadG